jgi:sortase A
MSSRPRRDSIPRVAEAVAWSAGLLLLAIYAGLRARQSAVAASEVRAFREFKTDRTRTTEKTEKTETAEKAAASARLLTWSTPDQSLWSPERKRGWQQGWIAEKPAALAVLRVPRIGLEVPVLEGTDDATLDRGAGHIADTPEPGASGNVGIAGHRDGFFRVLKDVVAGDPIDLETLGGTRRYVVENVVIVSPSDVWVLDATPSDRLTLVTCFPFYYAGSAPQRYIVRAAALPAP